MLIGIDASRANLKHKTGTEWYSFYLIKNLALIDKENKYRLYLDVEPSLELKEAIKDNPNFSFKLLAWPFNAFWTLGRLSLEMLFSAPEVLFIPAHTLPLFSPRKTINTIHDLAFVRENNLYRPEGLKTASASSRHLINFLVKIVTLGKYRASSLDYLYWSTNFALKKAWKIITVSNFTKKEILNFYPKIKPDKITVIHNGYNSDLYRPLKEETEKVTAVLKKYGLEKPFFLYVGRLEKKKNTPMLIEALAILRENNPEVKEKLVLIGNASFGYDEVKYVIEEFNLNMDVMMPGWVDENDLPYIFAAASAFIFPTRYEGFGIPVLQALACGLPTAISDLEVLREVAGESVLYFDRDSATSMAAAMKRIVSDENLRAELRQRGLKTVANFNFEKCARETLEVLIS
jgi:glycosyltransferase involved in cell wall biosynthesis